MTYWADVWGADTTVQTSVQVRHLLSTDNLVLQARAEVQLGSFNVVAQYGPLLFLIGDGMAFAVSACCGEPRFSRVAVDPLAEWFECECGEKLRVRHPLLLAHSARAVGVERLVRDLNRHGTLLDATLASLVLWDDLVALSAELKRDEEEVFS